MTSKKIRKISSYIIILFSFFFIFAFVSIFASREALLSLSEIIGLLLLFILSFYIIPCYVNTAKNYINFLNIINWTLFCLLIVGIIIGFKNPSGTFTNYAGRIRYKSIFENANELGSFGMLGYICSLALIYLEKQKRNIIPISINIILIILSDSRTSLYAIIIFTVIILFFYIYNQKKYRILTTKVSTLLLFLSIPFIIIFLIYKLENISLQYLDNILSGRIEIWISPFKGLDLITLLFGRGSFSNYENPHNYFIKSILSWGAISTIIFLFLIVLIIIDIINKSKNFKNEIQIYKIYNVSFAILITFLMVSVFESIFFNVGNLASLFLWFNLGIVLNDIDK